MSPCAELPPACQAAGSAALAGSEELLGIADSLRAAEQTADVNPHPEVFAFICDKENASCCKALV